jgi:hypothetical protein
MLSFPFRASFAWWLLVAAAAAHAQAQGPDLPAHLRGPWTTQPVAFGVHHATVRLPDGWSLQEGGIAVSDGEKPDCRIDFLSTPGKFEQQLASELGEDRKTARYAIHSELFRAGGGSGVNVVSARYTDSTGRRIEKRYFELPSDEGNTLLEWVLIARATRQGNDCVRRFNVVAQTFQLTPQPASGDTAPPD